jgi:hypothetical protein
VDKDTTFFEMKEKIEKNVQNRLNILSFWSHQGFCMMGFFNELLHELLYLLWGEFLDCFAPVCVGVDTTVLLCPDEA